MGKLIIEASWSKLFDSVTPWGYLNNFQSFKNNNVHSVHLTQQATTGRIYSVETNYLNEQ